MKIPHHIILDKDHPKIIDWNLMRDDPSRPAFFIPFNREDYIKSVEEQAEKSLYKEILNYCEVNNINKILSIGSGRSVLEYALKKNSELEVTVSDTTNSINRINDFAIFDHALMADYLNKDNFIADNRTLILLSRIDTEFSNENFKLFFEKLNHNMVVHIAYIPTSILNLKILLVEIKVQLKSFILGKKKVFCGISRTLSDHQKCWKKYYKIAELDKKKELIFLKKK